MERIRPAETATLTVVALLVVAVLLLVTGLGLVGDVPVEAFHRAALGLVAVGAAAAFLTAF